MIRRLFGLAVAGVCLLSLVLCLGAACLRWRSGSTRLPSFGFTKRWTSVNGTGLSVGWYDDAAPPPPPRCEFVHLESSRRWALAGLEMRSFTLAYYYNAADGLPADRNGRPLPVTYKVGSSSPVIAGLPTAKGRVFIVRPRGLIAALALPPLLWIGVAGRRVAVRGGRRRNGRCVECGYDLTGNVSGVCPECGAVAPSRGGGRAVRETV